MTESLNNSPRRNLGTGMLGKKHSEETKRKMSIVAQKTIKERLKNLSKGWGHNKGKKLSEETKQKLSQAHKGKKLAKEHKAKIGLSHSGAKHWRWKGGRIKHYGNPPDKTNPYIMIRMPNHPRAKSRVYVFEHIIIWEKYYKMRLPSNMCIHHLNGIKADNRPENLQAMKKGEHTNQTEPYKKRIRELEERLSHYPIKREEFPE